MEAIVEDWIPDLDIWITLFNDCESTWPDHPKSLVSSIKREDSINKLLKSECSSAGFAGVIKVCGYSFNIAKGLSQIAKEIGQEDRS